MTGCSEFIEFLRAEIVAACDDEAVADRIEREVRMAFGGERAYIPTLPDSRRTEAMRLLGSGMAPEKVARRVGVHPVTVYRWRRGKTKSRESGGLGRSDWVL